jgi:sec-independent protein translocase protein TatA
MPFQLGLPEIILVAIIALVFLGPKRLPEASRALGKGVREFRDATSFDHHRSDPVPDEPAPPPPPYTPPPAYAAPYDQQGAIYTPPAAPADQGRRQRESQ